MIITSSLKDKFIKINANNLHKNGARRLCEHWLNKAIGLNINMRNESNQAMKVNGDDDVYNLSGFVAGQISLVRQSQVQSYLWKLFSKANQYYQVYDIKQTYVVLHHISQLVHHLVYRSPLDERLWLSGKWWKQNKCAASLINTHDNQLLRDYFHINTLSAVYWRHYPKDEWREVLAFELDPDNPEDLLPAGTKSHLCKINLAINQFMIDEKMSNISDRALWDAAYLYTSSGMEANFYHQVIIKALHKSSHYSFSIGYMFIAWLWNYKNVKQASQFVQSKSQSEFVRGTVTLALKSIMIIDRALQHKSNTSSLAQEVIHKLYRN